MRTRCRPGGAQRGKRTLSQEQGKRLVEDKTGTIECCPFFAEAAGHADGSKGKRAQVNLGQGKRFQFPNWKENDWTDKLEGFPRQESVVNKGRLKVRGSGRPGNARKNAGGFVWQRKKDHKMIKGTSCFLAKLLRQHT